ncbi:MAG: ABC transporter substrate-binding protein [Betaproteobacteria bacterium]
MLFGLLAASASSKARPAAKIPKVGVLVSVLPDSPRGRALVHGLRDFGYVDGQNVAIEWRATGGNAERLAAFATELVRLNVDVIVAPDNPSIAAAQKATRTIPIVMVLASDPVGTGFVASLARPGGNITGMTFLARDLQGKSLQLLKEALPQVSRVVILWNPAESWREEMARDAENAARALGLAPRLVAARNRVELDAFFATTLQERPDAILIQPSQINFTHRARIAELAAKNKLATLGWSADTAEAGWLMAYGASMDSGFRRAGYYVDRILKGAKPAELPVEQPTVFELVINLKTARTLGVTIAPSLLLRADRVIE